MMKTLFFLFLLFSALLVTPSLAGSGDSAIARARKAIEQRERLYDRSKTSLLYQTLHPVTNDEGKPGITLLRYNPIAQGFREAIYNRSDITAAAKQDPEKAFDMATAALAKLTKKQQDAVRKLPPRAIDQAEPVDTAPPRTFPIEISDMMYAEALRLHLCKELGLLKHVNVQWILRSAVMDDRVDLIDYLVWMGGDVNRRDHHNATLLEEAVQYGSAAMVERLLYYGADLTQRDRKGMPLVLDAVVRNRFDIFKLLVNPADAQWKDEEGVGFSLYATRHNNVEMLDLLFTNGADKAWRDAKGQPLLYYAVLHGAVDVARYMLEDGGDLNGMSSDQLSYLEVAVEKFHPQMISLLLERGARQVNARGRHVLNYAILGNRAYVIPTLFAHGVAADDEAAVRAMLSAIQLNRLQMVVALLQAGVDPNAKVNEIPLLYFALEQSRFPIAHHMVQFGADVNAQLDDIPMTSMPAISDNPTVCKWLRHRGARFTPME